MHNFNFPTMNQMQLYLIALISLTFATTSLAIYARPGCNDTCGNIQIPYPFGIGADCYFNEWFSVDCNSSKPYLPAINNLQVLSLNLQNQTVNVHVSMISDCQTLVRNSSQILSVDLRGSPFLFSQEQNKFTVEGCGNAVIMEQENLLTGCSTICQNETNTNRNSCYGINCCQTSIPYYLETYIVNASGLQRQGPDGSCGSAFLVDETWYYANRFREQSDMVVPISLKWTLSEQDVSGTSCYSKTRQELYLGNGTTVESFKCSCSPIEEGSPYLVNGCEVVKECAGCIGECRLLNGTSNITCIPYQFSLARGKSSTLGVVLGVSISIGLLILSASEKPISLTRSGEHRSLATHFMLAMEEGDLMSIIDYRIVNDGSRGELVAIANLAMQCLNLNGKNRPTMKEVASELERIRMTHVPINNTISKYNARQEELIML
ncbi:hypothetical protein QVD17_09452 [Tagetes erecta]|uniref:Wall-associated receptor kinase galacturonan-binding domain-containing protein n=1 Tax=Tagetes erecta TaxID=13708 RepID=A0AAD8NYH4_TARER|nr:hypothetical protein QVD17_09452 [Tagetes erecta]